MSDVQLALLILGLVIIFIMIIHNWAQLKKNNNNNKQIRPPHQENNFIHDDENDPLFSNSSPDSTSASDQLVQGDQDITEENQTVSEKFINTNLPEGIYRDIESVASITTKSVFEGTHHLRLIRLSTIKGAKIYVRKDNDLWATDGAIDDSIKYNQILLVLLLANRKGNLSEDEATTFNQYVKEVNELVGGSILWLSHPDIINASKILNDFRKEVDRSLVLKVFPKSDSSFHSGPLIDFLNKPIFRINDDLFHELILPNSDNKVTCRLLNLSEKPIVVKHDTFLQGIIFKMDVPNTFMITNSFNELIDVIKEFNLKLNAILVDSSNKQLTDDQISRIYVYLKNIEKKLHDKKIPPGSKIAKRLFS